MIRSMTAFAREQSQGDWGVLTCELRSINHRYLEVSTHLSEAVRVFEMPLREQIRKTLKRGKVECSIRYRSSGGSGNAYTVNRDIVKELALASEEIAELMINTQPVAVSDMLRFPGVLEAKETDQTVLQKEVISLLDATLKDLIVAREREGTELNRLFLERMDLMEVEIAKIKKRVPNVVKEATARLNQRFEEAKVELDPGRLEQEMLIFAQKIDIAEEIDRANTHINEFRRVLDKDGVAGRRLDFLLQELNRESNTIGSKSTDPEITHAAVEMKVLIEQVREQVQNVE